MPIYEYTCQSCNQSFEHLHRTMTDGPAPACPECASEKTTKTLSLFAVASDTSKQSSLDQSPPTCGHCGGAPGSCSM